MCFFLVVPYNVATCFFLTWYSGNIAALIFQGVLGELDICLPKKWRWLSKPSHGSRRLINSSLARQWFIQSCFFSPPQEQAFYAMGLKEFRWAFERLPLGTGGPQFWRLQTHMDPLGNNSLSQRWKRFWHNKLRLPRNPQFCLDHQHPDCGLEFHMSARKFGLHTFLSIFGQGTCAEMRLPFSIFWLDFRNSWRLYHIIASKCNVL